MQVLVDVGAGNGYFSLAAAARGHDVIAFELSNASVASFEASARYNGFQKAITLHKVCLLGPLACLYGPLSWPSFLLYWRRITLGDRLPPQSQANMPSMDLLFHLRQMMRAISNAYKRIALCITTA